MYPVAAVRGRQATGGAASYPLLDNLIAYWNLSEASGNRADSHTNGLTLTDNNTVTVSGGGGPDGGDAALFVAANSEYLSRSSESLLQSGGDIDFSFAFWAYLSATGTTRTILNKGVLGVANNGEYRIYYKSGVLGVQMQNAAGTTKGALHSTTLSAATWYFGVAWHDSAADTVNIQVNNGAIVSAATSGIVPYSGAQPFRIGHPGGEAYWDGRIAYTGFWKRLLTANERTWLYNSGAGRTFAALAAYTG